MTTKPCPICKGDGWHLDNPANPKEITRCPACYGTGRAPLPPREPACQLPLIHGSRPS